jgi:catechol 2,3-dioxygenase-like lactoylglutathione lyase family enzyme
MHALGFDHCVIAVSDWDRSNAFYRNVLGAEIPPQERDAGARGTSTHVYFRDPDGSLLELVAYG